MQLEACLAVLLEMLPTSFESRKLTDALVGSFVLAYPIMRGASNCMDESVALRKGKTGR